MSCVFPDDRSDVTRREALRLCLMGLGIPLLAPALVRPDVPEAPDSGAVVEKVKFTLLDERACRPCRTMMSGFIRRNRAALEEMFPEGAEVFFAVGRRQAAFPDRTILIGTCAEIHARRAALYIPGCPPQEAMVMRAIRKARREFESQEECSESIKRLFGPSGR